MRELKLTQEVIDDFCAAVAIGCTYDAACVNAGISFSTYRNWALAGEDARNKKAGGGRLTKKERQTLEFLEAVDDARGAAKLNWQSIIDKAAKSDPMWAWRMLRVRDPESYMEVSRTELTGADAGPVQVAHSLDLSEMSDDALRDSLAALSRVAAQLAADGRDADERDNGGTTDGHPAA